HGVFTRVASKYDIMNDLMSMGIHRLWKDAMMDWLAPRAGQRLLDVAGGTGDIAFRMADRGADVTVADINQDMLDVGAERALERRETEEAGSLVFTHQNAEEVDFASNTFDAYTIVFGIRNVTFKEKALAEAHRVLRPGGRFYCMEFSTSEWAGFKQVYDVYSDALLPRMGQMIAGDADSYRYLVESIRKFPKMDEFKAMIRAAGFVNTKYETILGGAVAIHSGWKI
ncbi:MAG: class I SAM-dependent methyltransferase, partial [Pseudomonadota bacterium]